MKAKIFEVRDKGTFIPVAAIAMTPWKPEFIDEFRFAKRHSEADVMERERYLLRRSGYGYDGDCILLVTLQANGSAHQASYDPYAWGESGRRTMTVARDYIIREWPNLESGQVIDVEFILGEVAEPKKSEGSTDANQQNSGLSVDRC